MTQVYIQNVLASGGPKRIGYELKQPHRLRALLYKMRSIRSGKNAGWRATHLQKTTLHWRCVLHTTHPAPGFARVRVVGSRTAGDPSYRILGPRRQEPYCLFHYSLAGRGVLEVRGETYTVPEGSGILCRVADPDVSLGYPEDGVEPWRFLFVSFEGGSALQMTDSLVERYGHLLSLSPEHPHLRRFLDFEDAEPETTLSVAASAQLVNDLLLALSTAAENRNVPACTKDMVRQAQLLIGRQLNENINVMSVAATLGVSREHLTRAHKAETGITLHDYIRQRKIEAACELLRETQLSHSEIARRLGFGSGTHFARVFKSSLHMTPRRYRASQTGASF